MEKQTKEDFIAQRYVSLRKKLWLYRHIFLANDRNTNSDAILDRNLAVINAVIPDLWWVISLSLFQSIFSVLGDMFEVRNKTKGSILHKKMKKEESDESLLRQLKEYKLGHYNPLIKKLYLARDKYIAHTDKYTEDKFPIKLRDMNRLEKLLDEDDVILWRGKYPTMEDLKIEKKLHGDEKAWQREYMLKIIADDDQLVKKEWIQYYDELPEEKDKYKGALIGVDLAISEKNHADYTAIVVGHIYGPKENLRIYIEKNPINKRLDFPTTIEKIVEIAEISRKFNESPKLYIEDIGYQRSVVQTLNQRGVDAQGFPLHGKDKRARLDSVSYLIRQGRVFFPREGKEELIQQLVYFGVEKQDDLVDAFTIVLHMSLEVKFYEIQILNKDMLGL